MSIPGVDGVPVRAFLVMLVVFSVVIGPASYWFLRRKGQLVLLVLTAPLISLVSIVLLAGYALADEGLRVQGRAVTFTMLDQVRKQSATRATVSFYAPGLAPSGGLRFSRDVAVFPIGADGNGSARPDDPRSDGHAGVHAGPARDPRPDELRASRLSAGPRAA